MAKIKSKIIILGKNGFIAKCLCNKLKKYKINFVSFSKEKLNLEKKTSVKFLKKFIKPKDKIVFISAIAPVKNTEMLSRNIKILNNVSEALKGKLFDQLIYISSDAVFKDDAKIINENTEKTPKSLHGNMHLIRENVLQIFFGNRLCILRPTLIYGMEDPHNGYGPNKFYKNATNNQNIELFGNGEEKRDHIFVEDVAEIIVRLIKISYVGKLNATTGKTSSFSDIAIKVKDIINPSIEIIKKKRYGPMPHNGYRPFNNNKIFEIFPDFKFNNIENWLKDIK